MAREGTRWRVTRGLRIGDLVWIQQGTRIPPRWAQQPRRRGTEVRSRKREGQVSWVSKQSGQHPIGQYPVFAPEETGREAQHGGMGNDNPTVEPSKQVGEETSMAFPTEVRGE